jgi:hypothetical protein
MMTNPLVEPDRTRQIARGDETQIRRARDAAEALFKPKTSSAPEDARSVDAASVSGEQPPLPRRPRIIAVPPAVPREDVLEAKPDTAPTSLPSPRRMRAPRARKVTPSDHARIRILATHGLTLDQVAELYGVSPGTIERIVSGS